LVQKLARNINEVTTSGSSDTETSESWDLLVEKEFVYLSQVNSHKFEFFYNKYYGLVLNFVFKEIRDPDTAQDITNEVFSVALDNLNSPW